MIRVVWLVLLLAGCSATPAVIREPYEVERRVEVVRPVDRTYTDPLPLPALPEGPLTCGDVVDLALQWAAFGKTANAHRAKVAELGRGE